jgi:hypothetical protein
MSRHRIMRRLGMDGPASVPGQWFVRMVAGLGAMAVIHYVVTPTLGVTILSWSQLIDRFLALNHTFPTPGYPTTGPSPLLHPSPESSLPFDVKMFVTLVEGTIELGVLVCGVAFLWSSVIYSVAGPVRRAEMRRGEP